MVFGWRKAFCTSVSNNLDKKQQSEQIPTPRFRSKFGFLSNPSTPRLRSRNNGGGKSGCRSTASTAIAIPISPKLQCKTTSNATPRTSNSSSPKFFSNPSSPKSSSSSSSTSHGGVSLLRATLLLNQSNNNSSRCGICLQRVNSGDLTPAEIFTAECSHSFHLSCAVKLNDKRCPFCSATAPTNFSIGSDPVRRPEIREIKTGKSLRVYNDDEPLVYSPVSLAQINTIPESDENDDVEEDDEFPGFFSDSITSDPSPITGNLEVKFQPESAVVETGRRSETHVVAMKLKASSSQSSIKSRSRSAVDLVTVLDLSNGGANLQTVKHAMRLVISLLRETDRLSIVVFSTGSKRLMPLRRMSAKGRQSTRRLVDALVGGIETSGVVGMCVNDALKKAVKVVEDRREKNPTASIFVLSDGQDQPEAVLKAKLNSTRVPFVVSTTRFSNIPVHSVWIASPGALNHAPLRDAFTERIASLFNVALSDVKLNLGLVSGSSSLTEITAVYSLTGRPENFGSGSVVLIGDLFAEEEREYLVELKVPCSSSSGSHHVMSVRSSVVDPTTLQPMTCPKEKRFLIPRPQTVRFLSPSIERLRNLHSVCRAVADSRRLIDREDLTGAYQCLNSARSNASDDCSKLLEAELTELNRIKPRIGVVNRIEEKTEPLTPTSAWRAAEKLAKVAIMRKHLNRVSDMHGLENARF